MHGFYNIYSPLLHQPKEGEFLYTMRLLEHVFGEQLNLGLDYGQLLIEQPIQILPILCLFFKEQSTSKTTLLKWFKIVLDNKHELIDQRQLP